jgi:hypothetical protein
VSSAPAGRRALPVSAKRSVAGACVLALLAGAVWLGTRPSERSAVLQSGATALARPTLGAVHTQLSRTREEAARRAALEAAEQAPPIVAPAPSRASRKRRRTRRAVARSAAPSATTTRASELVAARPFDIASANRALSAAVARARFCGHGTTTKSVLATVTFDPSGGVRVLRVTPGAWRSRASVCVASALRRAKVPAFQGNPVTVSRRVPVSSNARARR